MADQTPEPTGLSLTPNQTQKMVLVRELVKIIGMVLVTTGWLTQEQAGVLMQAAIIGSGVVMMVTPIVFQLYNTMRKQQIATVSQMAQSPTALDAKAALLTAAAGLPEAKNINLDKSKPQTAALNAMTPSNVTAS